MNINSKTISWLILAGGLFLYLWNITDNQFTYATIFMAGSILLWMFVGFTTDSFDNKEFAQVLSGAGFLLALSVFFLYGLEEMSYPAGAIVFHSDGIAKALGLGIIASLPLLFGITDVETTSNTDTQTSTASASSEPMVIVEHEDYELADVEDLTSGEFDI